DTLSAQLPSKRRCNSEACSSSECRNRAEGSPEWLNEEQSQGRRRAASSARSFRGAPIPRPSAPRLPFHATVSTQPPVALPRDPRPLISREHPRTLVRGSDSRHALRLTPVRSRRQDQDGEVRPVGYVGINGGRRHRACGPAMGVRRLGRTGLGGVALALPLLALAAAPVRACTIVALTDGTDVLFCNNEDWSNPSTRIWFVPGDGVRLGCVYVGFDDGWGQGGLNTRGLAYDWVAGFKEKWEPDPKRRPATGGPCHRMLETSITV